MKSALPRATAILCLGMLSLSCSSGSKPPPAPDTTGDAGAVTPGDAAVSPDARAGDDAAAGDDGGGSFVATSIAVGARHACALTSAGGVRCWGDNRSGQLGDGTTTQRTSPVAVRGLSGGVVAIAAGDAHTCALDATGGVHCWGDNASGALGDGSTAAQRTAPVDVSGLAAGVVAIAAGGSDTCAAMATGDSFCWGANVAGQLGDGTMITRRVPSATVGVIGGLAMGPGSMAPGSDHTCMVSTGGSVVCSGDDTNGALGNGGNAGTMVYVSSGEMDDAVAVAAGVAVSCALVADGSVTCWGFGGRGELGSGSLEATNTPGPVSGLAGAAGIAVGVDHVCAVTTDGAVLCWGENTSGQIGDGTTTRHTTPVPVPALSSGVAAVATGGGSCALTAAGAVLCWGPNTFGQIGDGSLVERDTPAPVTGLP